MHTRVHGQEVKMATDIYKRLFQHLDDLHWIQFGPVVFPKGRKKLYSQKRAIVSAAILAGFFTCVWVPKAHADVPFTFIFLYGKLTYWWVIVIGLAIEATFLHKFFEMSWKKATVAALIINVASTLLGFVGLPLIFIPVSPLEPPETIVALIIIIAYLAVVDNLIELSLLRLAFRIKLSLRRFLIFLLANAITGALVYIALLTIPSKT
jgi:hypothetical protein